MVLKLTILLIVACGADLALRRASAALRHLIWTLTLISALLLPLGGFYAPKINGSAFVIHTSTVSSALLANPAKFNWLVTIYIAGVALFLVRLAFDIWEASRIVSKAKQTSLPGVLISDRAKVPFVWGSIVLPPGFEHRRAVIAHEMAHVARGDMWTSILAQVTCAIYWFHPLVWWAAARMRLEADRACDDAVLREGFADTGYAQDLVEVARSFVPARLAPGAIKKSQLETRVTHILAKGVDRRKTGAMAVGMAVLACLLIVSPLAALTQKADQKIYRVGNGVVPPRVLHRVDPQYTQEAKKAKTSGTVLLSLIVGSNGIANDIQVKHSLDPGLDESAVSAVRQWKFQPGMKDGKAVDVRASIEVNFKLK